MHVVEDLILCMAVPSAGDTCNLQIEHAQLPAVLQKAVCTTPAQKNSKQDIDPLIYLVAEAGLLPGDISEIAQDRGLSLRFGHGFDLL